jgi:hypothetical protein
MRHLAYWGGAILGGLLVFMLLGCEIRINVDSKSTDLPECTPAHYQHGGVLCVTPEPDSSQSR